MYVLIIMYYTIAKQPFVCFMLMSTSMFIAHRILFYSIDTGHEKRKNS